MVFFNYSRMQMQAKIVYYGPGLCGKTTNLHWIYNHTSGDSRGEMVSLETETDRTLFFDLLPIDVGTIAGFETRLQLYTVPGQVFYNTTRKLVLKGVDGVVFVADSQRPMLQANLDSFRNLEENIADMGLSLDSMPIVLQYNKRDLPDILSVEDLNRALNRQSWAWFESSAVSGKGVLETLKGISKLTLLALRQRLQRNAPAAPERPMVIVREPLKPAPPVKPLAKPAAAKVSEERPAVERPVASKPAVKAAPEPRVAEPAADFEKTPTAVRKGRKPVDALSELERLRKEAMRSPSAEGRASGHASGASPSNGHGQLFRDIQFTLKRADFARARRFSLSLAVEDEDHRVVEAVKGLEVEIDDAAQIDKVLLKLNIALNAKD